MAVEKLIAHFDSYLKLDSDEKEDVTMRMLERKIKRRQFILQEGDTCKHYSFVTEGLFKVYSVTAKGSEHNLQFVAENDWAADLASFHKGTPSQVYIEAIEPAVILQITKEDLYYLYRTYPKFSRIFRVLIENKFIELQNRVLQNISSTAEERYELFLNQYPNISGRLANTQIASYLGITPEFLSKIRKDISKK